MLWIEWSTITIFWWSITFEKINDDCCDSVKDHIVHYKLQLEDVANGNQKMKFETENIKKKKKNLRAGANTTK